MEALRQLILLLVAGGLCEWTGLTGCNEHIFTKNCTRVRRYKEAQAGLYDALKEITPCSCERTVKWEQQDMSKPCMTREGSRSVQEMLVGEGRIDNKDRTEVGFWGVGVHQ